MIFLQRLLIMLHPKTKPFLQNKNNLLAFSAGGDSSALFFLLLEANIPFDIAIVDYGIRVQSKEEVAYAKELAKKHHKECFVYEAPPLQSNFEAKAREIRYNFFEKLIATHHYDNLITAHHLGDRFEWMLMQFCKGAGCVELSGMQMVEKRSNYTLIRPLLSQDKSELFDYLQTRNIHYFEDETNQNETYTRNAFRHQHAMPLLQKYKKGIQKSFAYIDKDRDLLITEEDGLQTHKKLAIFKKKPSTRNNIYIIDKYLKSLGHIITGAERKLLEDHTSVVVGRQYIITHWHNYIVIAPFLKQHATFSKEFKEKMRLLKIDPKLRAYLALEPDLVEFLSLLLA